MFKVFETKAKVEIRPVFLGLFAFGARLGISSDGVSSGLRTTSFANERALRTASVAAAAAAASLLAYCCLPMSSQIELASQLASEPGSV